MIKSGVAFLTALAVTFTGLLATPGAAVAADSGLIAWYKLDETSGAVAADSSGNERTASVEGTAGWNSGHGFVFGGGSASSGNAIKLPDNIAAGLDSITVSFDVWVDPTLAGNHFVFNIGNTAVGTPQSGNGYLFATTTPYRAAISSAAWGLESSTARSGNLAKGEWKRVTYTQTGTVGTLYENGAQVGQNTKVTATPAQIGKGITTRNYIGRSAYAADNSFKGVVSDFRIYDRALSATDVSDLATASSSALAAADADWAQTALGDVSAVTTDLVLPRSGPARSTITWASSNPSAVSATGVVTRTAAAAQATLTATVTAGAASTTRSIAVTVAGSATAEQDAVDQAADGIQLPGIDDVRGNITLPTSAPGGVTVAWNSSDKNRIAADGVVARPAHGQPAATVTLTATIEKGTASASRSFTATVLAAPATAEYEAYLFSYFTDNTVPGEKIYFGASNGNDARNWVTLNGGQPALSSAQGTTGLRDPFLIRSPEGDRFFLIATDLSIGGGTSWDASQRTGSKNIEVWESTDLVNWSQQRHVKVSPDTAGNTWAPEAYWDDTIGAYVVFWASKIYAETDPGHTGSAPNVMMYATTRDFRTFTEAQVWQNTGVSRIDSTVIKDGDTYHRFTKDEASSLGCLDIFEETSTDLRAVTTKTSTSGTWALQKSCIGKGAGTGSVEGPSIVKANPGDVNGAGYYLFVDEFGGRKYIPLFSKKLGADADWSIPASYALPDPAPRHGTVLAITAEEQERLFAASLPAAKAVPPVALSTPVGTAAALPKTVAVPFADGSSRDLAVTWSTPPSGYFNTAGTIDVTGRVTGVGQSVTATITVVAAAGNVLLHYDFSQATGTTVPDSSSFGNNGAIRGTGATLSDGALNLPGGSSSSGAAYVQLPTGLFDGRDSVTVSAWLKNDTASGNYAAMFFGSAANPPSQYWLLNPKNPSGQVKSVITDGRNASSPWNTESGIAPTTASRGVPGPQGTSEWAMYTTVIRPGSITLYLDGVQVGSAPTSRNVSEFGSNLVAYIGKSSYADPLWKGSIRELTVNSTALSGAEVSAAYLEATGDTDQIDAALQADAAALDLGPARIVTDLDLADMGSRGSAIRWTSSSPTVLSIDGTVTRPASGDVDVTLTATLSLAGRSLTRDFAFTVLADTAQNDVDIVADRFDLAISHITDDVVLRTMVDGVAVDWSSSAPGVIGSDGQVVRPVTAMPVTLTAAFSLNGASAVREFTVTVLPQEGGRIGSYLTAGDSTRTDVLHLASSVDGADYAALQNGRGVLYPTLGSAKFAAPVIVRAPDGTFRLLSPEDGSGSRLYVYDSTDLTAFGNERLVSFTTAGLTTSAVSAVYDNGIAAYRLTFTAKQDGKRYQVTTSDFVSFTPPALTSAPVTTEKGSFPAQSLASSSIGVTAAEFAQITAKYSRVVNTGVRSFAQILVDQGTQPELPETAVVEYSSGDTTNMPVQWNAQDVAALADAAPGVYDIAGTVSRPTYTDPLVERRADPDVTLGDDGLYYFTGSYPMTSSGDPNGYDRVVLRRAETIQGLSTAPETTIWHENTDATLNRFIWAPELTKIGDDWYILFTAGRNGVWDIRPAMLKFTGGEFGGDAVLDPANWVSVGQVKAAPGDADAFARFSLDMTHFESGGKHYVVWAETGAGGSTLRMAQIDPDDPTQLTSKSILLSTPTYAWEKSANDAIDEGPAVIEKNGTIVIAFSASSVDDKYCVGVLTADAAADLLDPASWTKNPFPLLTTADVPGQVGPGHNSFTVDEYGNPVIVYHSRTVNDSSNPGEATDAGLFDPRRHARAATVHWSADGLPIFAMTADEELAPANKTVSVRVVVGDIPVPADPRVSARLDPAIADGSNGWYRSVPTVTLTVDSSADIEFRLDDSAWQRYSAPIQVSADGAQTITYRASTAGVPVDSSVGTLAVSLDRTAPSVSAAMSPASGVGTPDSPVVVTLSASDAASGVDLIEYRLPDGDWRPYDAALSFDEVGATTIEYRAMDRAGQVSQTAIASVVVSAGTPQPTIELSPSTVQAGKSISVTGRGYQPGETVTFTLFSDPIALGSATADASGSFTYTATIPVTVAPGTHTLRVAGVLSGGLAERVLRVTAATAPGLPDPGLNVPGSPGSSDPMGGTPGARLAATGAGTDGLLPAALALTLAGLALFLLRRRTRAS